jgi:hypothetical protein
MNIYLLLKVNTQVSFVNKMHNKIQSMGFVVAKVTIKEKFI